MITSEGVRKLVHIAIGFVALTLRWLTTWQAAGVAVLAILHNWLILPRTMGYIARSEKGWDTGIILYPVAVLGLILVFPDRPELAAAVWAIIAFGDGFATLVGRNFGGWKLPWNEHKSVLGSLAFVEAGIPGAYLVYLFVKKAPFGIEPAFLAIAATVLVCALVESLDLNLDDNFTVPVFGALTIGLTMRMERLPAVELNGELWIWMGINAALAVVAYAASSVSVSGMVGGFVLGATLILFAGWELYVVLLVFFVIGTTLTKAGYRKKAELGLAQEAGGRRGFGHAWSNVGVASIMALLIATTSIDPLLLWVAAIGSLATAAADTAGSEIGQLLGRKAFLPLTFKRVPTGTEGAISVEGTMAGLASGFVVSTVGSACWAVHEYGWSGPETLTHPDAGRMILTITLAAFLGSWIESLVGSWNRKKEKEVPNGALNFFNTMVGAGLAVGLGMIILT